ncbi:hypothetical protein [Streptosporangium roseum]|uniref:hypothetical protein n=1 Tax=Streptosporangium roseum TaxID=2001 RepID=UPI0033313BBC
MQDVVGIQYGRFRLMDWDGAAGLPDNSPMRNPSTYNDRVKSTPNFARIQMTFDDHRIDVRFELWDGPAPESNFESSAIRTTTWVGTFYASSGRVYATELIDPREHPLVFDLCRPETTWQMRVTLRRLAEEEGEDWDEVDDEDWGENTPMTSDGLEEVLFQFWTPVKQT